MKKAKSLKMAKVDGFLDKSDQQMGYVQEFPFVISMKDNQ